MKILDLSGEWLLHMDDRKQNDYPERFEETILLPSTTSISKKGAMSDERATGYLTDTYKFEGYAWYSHCFELPSDLASLPLTLYLERTRKTRVYLDGKQLEQHDSLCTPHETALPQLSAGIYELTILVDNTDYPTRGGHLTSPDTQTNWNGITGKIELRGKESGDLSNVRIASDLLFLKIHVEAEIDGEGTAIALVKADNKCFHQQSVAYSNGKIEFDYTFEEQPPLWDEFNPSLLELVVQAGRTVTGTVFGMRQISSNGRKLLINGNETFLRGKHDGLVFPLTGAAPTDVESWLEVMKTAKSYGINHYRFHTCCPPDAAFTAADILGIYMEPELPFWGTIAAEGEEGYNKTEQEYLIQEGLRILDSFGNHPSFVLMSLGNELWGSKERLGEILTIMKKHDNRRFYTQGSNNFQFVPTIIPEEDVFCIVRFGQNRLIRGSYAMCDAPQGHIQTAAPNSSHVYDLQIVPQIVTGGVSGGKITIQYGTGTKEVEADDFNEIVPQIPVISHEVGQYETYPDFAELELYKGSIKPFNLVRYREKLESAGLFSLAEKLFRASGALAVDCYKREIESALGTKNLAGFQLLDLQDFPGQGTALVGILNVFMRSKGLISPERWRGFCAETVLLAQLDGFVYTSGEKVSARIVLSDASPYFNCSEAIIAVTCDDKQIVSERLQIPTRTERVTELGEFSFTMPKSEIPQKLTLTVSAGAATNSYTLYSYPETNVTITDKMITDGVRTVKISDKPQENSLVILPADGKLVGTYCTDFWCYPMFKSISESVNRPVPIGTLGLLIDVENPITKAFGSDFYTTPQWYEIVTSSHCEEIFPTDNAIVRVIDNPDRCKSMALLFEREGNLYCTSRIWERGDKNEVKYFAKCILNYLSN